MLDGLFESLCEVTMAALKKGQLDITRLFKNFPDRVKDVASSGGAKVSEAGRDFWRFGVASASEKGKKYDVPLFMTNIVTLLRQHVANNSLWVSDGSKVDLNKLAAAMYSDVDYKLTCTCPAFQFYGGAYQATKDGYKYGKKEVRPPVKRNPKEYGVACKHLQLVMDVLPFYRQSFARYLKEYYGSDISALEKEFKEVKK